MGACLSANGNLFKKTKRTKGPPTFPAAEASTARAAANPKSTSRARPRPARSSRRITILRDPCRDGVFRLYSFGKELGRGEFGITYQCRDNGTGETVACKTISKKKLRTEIDVEDVRREVDIMRHLPSHPNIVKYKEVYEDKEAVSIVIELCQGGELFDRIVSRGHYTERGAATITKTILEVIQDMAYHSGAACGNPRFFCYGKKLHKID